MLLSFGLDAGASTGPEVVEPARDLGIVIRNFDGNILNPAGGRDMTDNRGPERKKVDLTTLPVAAQYGLALATVAVVVGLALLVGDDVDGPDVPTAGLVAGVVAAVAVYALMAWRRQHR